MTSESDDTASEPPSTGEGTTDGICATCGRLRHQACPHSCSCSPPDPAFSPEAQIPCELCNVCGLETIRGGSRWHRLLCTRCMRDVQDLNRAAGRLVVPIGIHSIMNGIGVKGTDAQDPDKLAAFTAQFNEMNVGIEGLRDYGTAMILERCRQFGLRPVDGVYLLREYLDRCTEAHITRQGAMTGFVATLEENPR